MNQYRKYLSVEDADRLEDLLAGPWPEAWTRVRDLWSRADAVYVGMIGPAFQSCVKLEYFAALELPRRFPESLQALFPALYDPSPILAAYSLLALREAPGWSKDKLSDSVLKRREDVEWQSGCFRWRQSLGEGLAELAADQPRTEDPWERVKEAERRWAGRERSCPKCGASFVSVQDLGTCPSCRHAFRASEA